MWVADMIIRLVDMDGLLLRAGQGSLVEWKIRAGWMQKTGEKEREKERSRHVRSIIARIGPGAWRDVANRLGVDRLAWLAA